MIPKYLILHFLCLLLYSCEPVSLEPPASPDFGSDNIRNFHIEKNVRVALYQEEEAKQSGLQLNYGSMDAQFITIGKHEYMVEWSDIQDFKNIRIGEKLHFRSAKYFARVEKTGRIYKVVKLNEL